MRATLSFNLDDRDDLLAHRRACKSLDLALAVVDLQERIRNKLKHEGCNSDDYRRALEDTQGVLLEIMDKYGILLEDLIE